MDPYDSMECLEGIYTPGRAHTAIRAPTDPDSHAFVSSAQSAVNSFHEQFEKIDQRFNQVHERFDGIEKKLDELAKNMKEL